MGLEDFDGLGAEMGGSNFLFGVGWGISVLCS